MKDSFKTRVRIIYFLIFIFFLVLTTRLFFVQVVRGYYYKDLASQQYVAPAENYFDRGEIFFKNKGNQLISAASIKNGFQLVINPEKIKDIENIYQKLSQIITLDKNDFISRASKKNDSYETVAHKIEDDDANKIKNLTLPGVSLYSETWRYYPGNNLASRVLGFVGYDNNTLNGRYGVEKFYDSILKRGSENGFVNSFAALFTDIKGAIIGENKIGDVVLSIEPSVQAVLEKNLEKIMVQYKGELAGGIIMDPKTGEIIAMSAKPDFNPNSYGENKNLSLFINPLVENVFEFGSIMKPITLGAALDEGKITASTTYYDSGAVEFNGQKIQNFDNKARGLSTMQDVLSYSINTGAVFAMQQLGKQEFAKYLASAGFGEKTGIDLPGEVSGKISNVLTSPRDIEYATASFGQGIAVTPIEMARALSSLANGGYLVRPYVTEEIKLNGSKNQITKPQIKAQIFKKETTEEMSRMLVNVFDKGLLGGTYKMDHYSIAAKTGTAQMTAEGQKGYQEGQYLHSFFGYFPAFDPKFFVFLFTVRPQGVSLASHSLTKPFVNITKFLINYYNIAPDR
ncbi:MAG: stage V sporulation protein D (sporulation-specific penicillin-binding protein) [Parcubacteria group bacterium Athens0714_24]|nr:MAG: stage V sporulation protein D (sporulation-specific penicillin-binding protein) [Parcubacteria group bacterium Athens0714_24]